MDDDVAAVDQNPVAAFQPFRRNALDAFGFQLVAQMTGHGADMPRRAACGDDHEICDAGFVGEFDDDEVVRLVVFQRRLNHGKQAPAICKDVLPVGPGGLGLLQYDPKSPVCCCQGLALAVFYRDGLRARMSVADCGFKRQRMNAHAGGLASARRRAEDSFSRYRAKVRAALPESAPKE